MWMQKLKPTIFSWLGQVDFITEIQKPFQLWQVPDNSEELGPTDLRLVPLHVLGPLLIAPRRVGHHLLQLPLALRLVQSRLRIPVPRLATLVRFPVVTLGWPGPASGSVRSPVFGAFRSTVVRPISVTARRRTRSWSRTPSILPNRFRPEIFRTLVMPDRFRFRFPFPPVFVLFCGGASFPSARRRMGAWTSFALLRVFGSFSSFNVVVVVFVVAFVVRVQVLLKFCQEFLKLKINLHLWDLN